MATFGFPETSRVVALVDDEPHLLRIMGRVLEELGHRVILFDDPVIAAESIPLEHVDAVFVDLKMPGMSGVEVARRLRERSPDARPPILLVTGDPHEVQAEDRALFASIHAKPIRSAELTRALRGAIRRRSSHTRLRVPVDLRDDPEASASGE